MVATAAPSTSLPSLIVLLRAVRAAGDAPEGDTPLGALLERLHPVVERFARTRLTGFCDVGDIAADVAQETLIRIANAASACRAETDRELMAWVLTTTRRVLIDLWRAPGSGLAVRQFSVELDATAGYSLSGASSDYDPRESSDSPHELLLRLAVQAYDETPDATASLIWWRLVGGAEWSEVALRLVTTEAGAKRRFQRAQRSLRAAVVRLVAQLPSSDRAAVDRLLTRYTAPFERCGVREEVA